MTKTTWRRGSDEARTITSAFASRVKAEVIILGYIFFALYITFARDVGSISNLGGTTF